MERPEKARKISSNSSQHSGTSPRPQKTRKRSGSNHDSNSSNSVQKDKYRQKPFDRNNGDRNNGRFERDFREPNDGLLNRKNHLHKQSFSKHN